MRSQNGWSASPDRDSIGVVPFTVAGVSFPNGVRRGDVETVLRYVAERFHATVEPLRPGWCWGYHYKRIEGSSALSNHASATAADFNAPAHPMGRRGTFSPRERAAIRRILDDCEGVVRWGGDYSGRADEMHFEIVAPAVEVARVATKIRNGKVGDDMAFSDAEMRAFPWQYNGRGMPGVPENKSTLWVLGTIYSTQRAILAAMEGLDSAAILARIDQLADEAEQRDAELRVLVERGLSGELAAGEVVRLIGEKLVGG